LDASNVRYWIFFDKHDGVYSVNRLVVACYEIRDLKTLPDEEKAAWLLDIEAKVASVKRALASLKAKGKVFSFHRDSNGLPMWAGEQYGLYVTVRDMQ
jgi:hypothetical protein